MSDNVISEPVGASVWEHELFGYLTDHVRLEGAMLQEYSELAERTESKAMAYLVNLLIEDERRHHRFFAELVSSLKADVEVSRQDPVIPRMDFHNVDQDRLLETAKLLLDKERADAKELKELRKKLRDVKDTTMWDVLADIMTRDTDKHMAILQFVIDHVDPKRNRNR